MGWIIRNAQKEDAQGILDILNPIIKEGLHTVLDTPFFLEEELQFIEEFPENGVFHVAINSQKSTNKLNKSRACRNMERIWFVR